MNISLSDVMTVALVIAELSAMLVGAFLIAACTYRWIGKIIRW